MEWKSIEKTGDGQILLPASLIFPHYYEALNALFRIENALRVFVYVVLKSEFKNNWQTISIVSDDAAESTIGKIAKQRMNQAKQFGYLGYQIPCPLMYMTSGELIRIITSDSYWKHFSPYFLGSKEIIKLKLNEIGTVRNALAHFRPIKKEDVELVKQNAQHIMPRIETCLVDMMRCANVVPTNTKDEWYMQLRTLGTDNCEISLTQSDDEKWVQVALRYKCPILSSRGTNADKWYRVLTINTSSILRAYPDLLSFVIYLSESVKFPQMEDNVASFRKSVVFLFSREVLNAEFEKIKQQLESLLGIISEETGLLKEDNLARGELVIGVDARANLTSERYWQFSYNNLKCVIKENDPPEYWGEVNFVTTDYVTSTSTYPWMSTDISEEEFPF